MVWIFAKPTVNDKPDEELASLLTTNKTSIASYVDKHFFFTDSSGASAGIPRLSDGSFGPGSARAAYIPGSAISASTAYPLKSGSLIVTSDTNRLIGMSGSTTSVVLATSDMLVAVGHSGATITQGSRWLVQTGSIGPITASGTTFRSFTTAYGAVPIVLLQPTTVGANLNQSFWSASSLGVGLRTVDASGFTIGAYLTGSASTVTVLWRSEGTVAL